MSPSSAIDARASDPILTEAMTLLPQLAVDADAGSSCDGERVTVRVTPEVLDRTLSVLVTCYAYGHRLTDWRRLRIAIVSDQQPEPLSVLPLLDERGQTRVRGLDLGQYRLAAFWRLPKRFRLAQGAGDAARQQRFAYLQQAVDGQVHLDQRVQTLAPTPGSGNDVVSLNAPTPFAAGDDLVLRLVPWAGGLTVHAEPAEGSPAPRQVEVCIATADASGGTDRIIASAAFVPGLADARLDCSATPENGLLSGPFDVLWRGIR